jgi:putative transposase
MPRKKFYPTDRYPYHVTARCHNKSWFDLPIDQVWDIFARYLYFITLAFGVRVHSFVLMNNHFHMLITTPNANLDKAMGYLLREVSKAIGSESGNINQVFGGPYHWSLIKNHLYYHHAYKYVYRNPVEAGLCPSVESYTFSTIRGLLGKAHLPFPAFDNLGLITDPGKQLQWLNAPYPFENFWQDIETALSFAECEFHTQRGSEKPSPLATRLS